MKCVLSKLKNSKFDLNHLFSCAKTVLRSLCNWLLLGLVIKMYIWNNTGERPHPCHTPLFMRIGSDILSLNFILIFIFL